MSIRYCNKCGRTPLQTEFGFDKRAGRVRHTCRECDAALTRLRQPPSGKPRGRPLGRKNKNPTSEESRESYREAALRRVALGQVRGYKSFAKRRLERDLELLRRAIRTVRVRIVFAEKNRRDALLAYHKKGHKRRLRKTLENAYRRAIRPSNKNENLSDLVRAAHRVGKRFFQPQISKLRRRLRRYFEKAVHRGSKSARIKQLLGCSVAELRVHLEKQFQPGMTWENHSFRGWHIDHKRPLASFDLTDPVQQAQAFHYTNLQPLWAKENQRKRDTWESPGGLSEVSGVPETTAACYSRSQ